MLAPSLSHHPWSLLTWLPLDAGTIPLSPSLVPADVAGTPTSMRLLRASTCSPPLSPPHAQLPTVNRAQQQQHHHSRRHQRTTSGLHSCLRSYHRSSPTRAHGCSPCNAPTARGRTSPSPSTMFVRTDPNPHAPSDPNRFSFAAPPLLVPAAPLLLVRRPTAAPLPLKHCC
jgi:hypothetical protein